MCCLKTYDARSTNSYLLFNLLQLLTLLHLQVVDVVSSSRENDFGKFHDHESVAGTLLMLLQVSERVALHAGSLLLVACVV